MTPFNMYHLNFCRYYLIVYWLFIHFISQFLYFRDNKRKENHTSYIGYDTYLNATEKKNVKRKPEFINKCLSNYPLMNMKIT